VGNLSDFEAEDIYAARVAYDEWITWSYKSPEADFTTKLLYQMHVAYEHKLSPEAKRYFSVLVNEACRPSVSGKEDYR